MFFFSNADINRLAVHHALHQLGFSIAGAFISAFLLRAGLPPAEVFLAFAGILGLRFALRPLVLAVVPILGARRTLVLGTLLFAFQYLPLARVEGVGPALFLWIVVAALGEVFYWTCYHAFFAALGDRAARGRQLGVRQALLALANIAGPAAGGAMLAAFGPWAAFGTAAAVTAAAVIPLRGVAAPAVLRQAPAGAFRAARIGMILFMSDGWIVVSSAVAWDMAAFRTLASRYDAFGGVLALAALAGAVGSLVLGRFIDQGHARRAVLVNAAGLAAVVLLKALCAASPPLVLVAVSVAAAFGGFYIPVLMTAVYNAAKASPCPLRFHFAAEGGWDCGGAAACLAAAAILSAGATLPAVLLLALPAIPIQALLLWRRHARLPSGDGEPIIKVASCVTTLSQ
jgi:MFS transporter, DHA1 family, inner membrane transport protein